jgi:transposase
MALPTEPVGHVTQIGIDEGNVNKLKLIKRMGYGRAGFAQLRQRVLHLMRPGGP